MNTQTKLNNLREVLIHVTNLLAEGTDLVDLQRLLEWPAGPEVATEGDPHFNVLELQKQFAAESKRFAAQLIETQEEYDRLEERLWEVVGERDALVARVDELEVALGESKPEANSLRKVMERAVRALETECRDLTNRNIEVANERDDLAGKLALVQECFRRIDKLFMVERALSLDEYKLCLGLGEPEVNSLSNERSVRALEAERDQFRNECIDAENERDRLRDQLERVREVVDEQARKVSWCEHHQGAFYVADVWGPIREALKPAPLPAVVAQEPAVEAGPGGSETQVPGPEGIGATPFIDGYVQLVEERNRLQTQLAHGRKLIEELGVPPDLASQQSSLTGPIPPELDAAEQEAIAATGGVLANAPPDALNTQNGASGPWPCSCETRCPHYLEVWVGSRTDAPIWLQLCSARGNGPPVKLTREHAAEIGLRLLNLANVEVVE